MKLPDGPRLPALLQTLQIIAQPTQFLEQCAHQYGDSFTLRVLGLNSPPIVFLSHPETVEAIFTTESHKLEFGQITHVFQPLTGTQSLIMQDGKRHQRLRQLLMPPLHGKQLQAYGQMICEITERTISDWNIGSSISIREYTSEIALKVILQVVLGLNSSPRYHQLRSLIKPFLESVNSPLNSIQFFWPPLQQDLGKWSPWGKFLHQQRQIDELIYAEIAERRTQRPKDDVLSLLIAAKDETGQTLTDPELRDQLITLLLLGLDTTASALAWAFYWIHQDFNVLSQLVQELKSLGENPDPMKIAQLPFLTAVCQETLRIHPIALISQPRLVQEKIQLEGYEFEPGTVLVPCIHLAHRRTQVYPNPEQFQPERFIQRKFSPYEYFAFGGGSRSCIGMALSMFEMKLILATVLSRYDLMLSSQALVKPVRRGITIVPSHNFKLTIARGSFPKNKSKKYPIAL